MSESRSRGAALSAEQAAHAAACPVCRRQERLPLDTPPADLFDSVLADVSSEHGPGAALRNLSTGARLGIATAAVLLCFVAVALTMPRWHYAEVPVARVVLVVTVLSALLALSFRLGLRPLQAPPVRAETTLVAFLVGAFAPLAFALLPAGGATLDVMAHVEPWRATGTCFSLGGAIGVLAVVLLRLLDRGAHASRGAALFAAVAGGLAANAALELHCPITDRTHLVVGHAGVALVLLVVYGLVPRRGQR